MALRVTDSDVGTGTETKADCIKSNEPLKVSTSPSGTGAPLLASLAANAGRPGDNLTVTVTGSGLSGASAVSFGPGIAIGELRAVSDTEMKVMITINSAARAGKRDVTVTTPEGIGTIPGGFTVNEVGKGVDPWVYPVSIVGGLAALGMAAASGMWLRRRAAKPAPESQPPPPPEPVGGGPS